ncbi:nitrate reductase associated protein [Gluconacetobacter takamatsuzukensis]|uniref:Nitrate reductase maturation protein NarM n=1 Tax=Gluconacetobacter takamatsuzukensis TaxID=1286190 RepID=A0A7W4KGS0_9PROT|nr:nitrate reductase associated protein [Gluconacetobacter takamatsuzukensis]MBB2206555.1 nitrate reductase maturation protein NarM [Gluconacetobacter takamatsuzukensis]
MIFDFESDFAGSLRCIPMIARQKLDIAGIKLSLRQWSRFSREERGQLADLPCETVADQEAYRALVLHLIAVRSDEPPRHLAVNGFDDWREADRMPEAVRIQAEADGVAPPTPAQWARLTPLQRFALIKLARSQHENENFVPAMKEFGVL